MAIQPTITGTVGGQLITQNSPHDPFTGVVITTNPTPGEDTLTFNLTSNGVGPSGTLSGGGGGTLTELSPTEWELIAPGSAIQADARLVAFDPSSAVNTTVTTTFALQDTSSEFPSAPSAVDTTTTVTNTVTGPTITGIIGSQTTTNGANIPLFSGVTVADSSNGTNTLRVTLSAPNGTLSDLGTEVGLTYTVTGTAAVVTADLAGAVFHPNASALGSITSTVFSLTDTSTGLPATPPTAHASTTVTNAHPTNSILFQNTDGQPSTFQLDGPTIIGGIGPVGAQSAPTVPLNPGPSWTAVGTADFFGSDRADILWQNTSAGQVTIWDMNGNNRTGGGPVDALTNPTVPLNPGPDVKVVGTGLFNGDAFTDILLQNTSTGQASIWDLNGAGAVIANGPTSSNATPSVPLNPGPGWTAVGTGDFNHDGRADILWQNSSTGELSIWNMGGTNGTTVEHHGPVTSAGSVAIPGPDWKAIGTGNFTGGLFSDDILLQNQTTGQVSVWDMGGTNGTSVVGSAAIGNPGLSWRAAGSDGLGGDILLQNTGSGQTSIWAVHDLTLTSHGPVSGNLGPSSMAVSLTHFT